MAAASLAIAVTAILIALASAVYARRSAVASEKATAIDATRLHDDLTPDLRISFMTRSGGRAEVELELTGPRGLDRLDGVTVRIRDDRPDRSADPYGIWAGGRAADLIWGPYRFTPGIHRIDRYHRQQGPFSLSKNEPCKLALEQNDAVSDDWRRQFDGAPLRLAVTCRREGYEPWTVLWEGPPALPRPVSYPSGQ